jgi:hypothetical protein
MKILMSLVTALALLAFAVTAAPADVGSSPTPASEATASPGRDSTPAPPLADPTPTVPAPDRGAGLCGGRSLTHEELAAARETGGGLACGPLEYSAAELEKEVEVLRYGIQTGLMGPADVAAALEALGLDPTLLATEFTEPPVRSSGDVTLPMPHISQSTSYYCGPAAGLMILFGANITQSRTTGEWLSQDVLANSSHMQTTTNGTDRLPARFAGGLNAAMPVRFSTFSHTTPTSVSHMRNLLASRLDHGMGAGVNTVEYADGRHLNDHPKDRTIYHWWASHGHTDNVEQVRLHDPAWGSTALPWQAESKTIGPYATTLFEIAQYRGIAH